MRLSKNKLIHHLSGAYIAVFRSTPLLVQLYIVYYGPFYASSCLTSTCSALLT